MVRVLKSHRQEERLSYVSVRQEIYRPIRRPDAIVIFQRYIPIIRFAAESCFCKARRFGITSKHLPRYLGFYPLAVMASNAVGGMAQSELYRLKSVVGALEVWIAHRVASRFHRLRGGCAERLKMRLADIVRAIPDIGESMRNH